MRLVVTAQQYIIYTINYFGTLRCPHVLVCNLYWVMYYYYCRATPVSRSTEDVSAHSSQEHDPQPNGHPVLLPGDQSSQVSVPLMPRHRRGSVDSGITKHLSVERERSNSPSSSYCSVSPPIEEPSNSSTFDLDSLSIERPSTPQTEKFRPRNGNSTTGITSKASEPIMSSSEVLTHSVRGHSRASSVGNSPLWSQKGHKRMGSHPSQ